MAAHVAALCWGAAPVAADVPSPGSPLSPGIPSPTRFFD